MPLREFLRMFGESLESSQPIAPSPTGIASGPERELVELVYENGQFLTQGQPSRAKKSPQMNDFQWQSYRAQDKHSGPSVPSGHVYLTQDEIDPWLNYAEDDDGFRQDFCADISAEISGVTSNDPPGHNSFLSLGNESFNQMPQHSNLVPVHHDAILEVQNATKAACRNGFANPCLPKQGQVSVPPVGCGPSNIDTNTTSNRPNVSCGNAVGGQASANDFESMKTPKQNSGMPGSGTNIINFSYFSRPATNYRAGLEKVDCSTASCSFSVENTGNDKLSAASDSTPMKSSHMIPCTNKNKGIYSHAQPKLVLANVDSKEPVAKQPEESCHAEQSYIKSPGQAPRQVTDYEKHVEHVVAASSVGSGNSDERASNDQIPSSKRKSRDVDEAESPSEDNEEESVGAKKRSHARGCSSSKRSRAAEVHNLSERRRRDRINEKMRALQELIPNCNKADKASMLDEAIEYLKTLQLQVQMMSMGAGLCMPPMMYPHGLQHMHPAHMPHFSAFPSGMGMGYGMGMLDMISGSPRYPIYPVPLMQGGHFRSPAPGSAAFRGMAGLNHQVYGHPGQGMPMPVARGPSVPPMGQAPISSAVSLNDSTMRVSAEAPTATPVSNSGFAPQNENSHLARNSGASTSLNQTANQLQATNKDFEQPVVASTSDQAPNVSATAPANLTTTKDTSRKGGDLTVSEE